MATTFHFVNSTEGTADQASRRSLRRHVMKGKNAGKTLSRSSRTRLAEREADTATKYRNILVPNAKNGAETTDRGAISTITGPSSVLKNASNDCYFSFAFPIKITKTELDIMNMCKYRDPGFALAAHGYG